MKEHALNELNVLTETALAVLRQRWIETAEQLLGAAATPEGKAGLQGLLACDGAALEVVLARLGAVVGPALQAELARPVVAGKLGLIIPENPPERPGAG
ncbi:MAG: hypothetical protein WCT12_25855 [Verrucomicrobiota bacterium]